MFKRFTAILMILVFAFVMVGCMANVHKVGNGAQGFDKMEKRQWYILWGLVPLNDVDTQNMAGDAMDYTIKTEHTPLDIVMNIFTGYITVYSRTVTVTK
jgi:hypothetical protein